MFPGRIDIGIGRAPGGSAEATNVLSDHFLQNVWKMPELVRELLQFIDDEYVVPDNPYVSLSAAPVPKIAPIPWLLGTGRKSAELAAAHGLPYAFGKFMSDQEDAEIIKHYKRQFQPRKKGEQPEVILTVSCICAEDDREAEEIALSTLIWSIQREKGKGHSGVPSITEAKQYPLTEGEKGRMVKYRKNMVVGNPEKVVSKLREMKKQYQADEIMIVTITHSPEDRIRSYHLIMDENNKEPTL